ncbi:MAG: cytochrome P450 [Gemmatimonadota bacterium]|nr:cytochrome P450 [Gemmatimonadota bacterium]MDH3423091.1 cytochrome P450 [Gemmatimonadota bacterium]
MLPPGPRFAPLQTYRYVTRPADYLAELRVRYGDVVLMPSLNGPVAIVFTPELAKTVFSTPPDHYDPFGTDAIGPLVGAASLFTTSGAAHRRGRKLLSPPFNGARMRAYGGAIQDVAAGVLSKVHAGDDIRVLDLTTEISVEIILRTVFGVADERSVTRGRQLLTGVLDSLSPALFFTKRLQTPLFPPYRRFRRAFRAYNDFVADTLVDRRRGDGAGEDVLSLLLGARDEEGNGLADAEIQSHLLTLLVAGHETTSIVLAWAIHELMSHPDALAALREEVAGLGPDPSPEALTNLPYIDAVVKETQRRRTIVTDVIRKLVKPLEIGGFRIPPGLGVAVGVVAIHNDPDLFPEPHQFRPERFLNGGHGPSEHMPFGGGHRRCIGAAFSDYESRIVLATLMPSLDLEPRGPVEVPVRRNVTMGPKFGVRAWVAAKR